MMMTIRIGTRGSVLALWQARAVASRLEAVGASCEIVPIKTTGDRLGEVPLADAGGKRLFVKELEDALLARHVDVAVHSAKDMPVDMPPGLIVAAVLEREEPWDAIVLPRREAQADEGGGDVLDRARARLGDRPRLGTSSLRRVTQLHRWLPGAMFHPIRGNLDTRLRKLDEGQYDAIVLAVAGLKRVGAEERISARLPLTVCVPAPAQGAIATQIREDAAAVRTLLNGINHSPTLVAITAERALVRVLGGGCQAPIGALAIADDAGGLELHGAVTSLDGEALRAMAFGKMSDPEALGRLLGERLLADGASDLLEASTVERFDE